MSKQKTNGCLVNLVGKCYPSACIMCFWRYVIIVHLELYWCLIYWQWKKSVVRKAWVTSVAFTFTDWKRTVEKKCCQESMGHKCGFYLYGKKNCSQESMGHECCLDIYGKKNVLKKAWVMSVAFTFTDRKWTMQKIVPTKNVCKVKMDCEARQNPCWRSHLEISRAFVVHIALLMFPMLYGVFLFKPVTLSINTS